MAHLDDEKGFLGPAQIGKLRGLIDRGYRTAQQFITANADDPDTNPSTVEILRQPPGGGKPVSLGVFNIIMINFGQRGIEESGDFGPITLSRSSGIMHHEQGEFSLRVDDVVVYNSRPSKVVSTYPPRFGVIISELELVQ